jgi:hypothetical protein
MRDEEDMEKPKESVLKTVHTKSRPEVRRIPTKPF